MQNGFDILKTFNTFLDKISIKRKIIMLIVLMAAITFMLCNILNYFLLKDVCVSLSQNELSSVTEIAKNVISEYKGRADKGEFSEAEAKTRAIKRINSMRFNGKNYIWINDYNSVLIAHPTSQGKDLSNVVDKNGIKVVPESTKIAREKGEGVLKYQFAKPGEDPNKAYDKISYIRHFPEWGWVIGAGQYTDEALAQANKIIYAAQGRILLINILIVCLVVYLGQITFGENIVTPIEQITKVSKRLADNDFTVIVQDDVNKTEIGELNRSFKTFINNSSNLIRQVISSASDLSVSSKEISDSSEQSALGSQHTANSTAQLAEGAQNQADSVSKGLESVNQINSLIKKVTTIVDEAAKEASVSTNQAQTGYKQANEAINKIMEIKTFSQEISQDISELGRLGSEIEVIVDLIKAIAAQTDLLALNAAIEAARAGENGKGFAVVADEVKKLAGQSAEATDKITGMIKEIQNKTNHAVTTMDNGARKVDDGVNIVANVGEALQDLATKTDNNKNLMVKTVGDMSILLSNSDSILRMMENISAVTEETSASAEEISSITEQQTASLQEISASAQMLTDTAKNLDNLIRTFKA